MVVSRFAGVALARGGRWCGRPEPRRVGVVALGVSDEVPVGRDRAGKRQVDGRPEQLEDDLA